MVAPVVAAAIISGLGSVLSSAMQKGPAQPFAELPDAAGGTLEGMDPTFQTAGVSPGASDGGKSAIGRTLQGLNDVTVTADAPQLPLMDQGALDLGPTTLGGIQAGGPLPPIQPPTGNVYDSAAPQDPAAAAGGGGALGGMDGMQLAQLGLMLGSMLSQPGPPGPRPPGLPGSSMAPMRPVFRG